MPTGADFRFHDIVGLCREHSLFSRLVGTDGEDFEPGKKNILSKIFPKSDSRIFPAGKIFRAARQTKHVVVFYVGQSA